jgi:nucleotide-binding universal stress UspA family protein
MKTILILTDFTENAAHAALSGVRLSEKLHTNILLLNVNISHPVMPQYIGGPTVIEDLNFWIEESKIRLQKLSGSLEPLVVHTDPTQRKPTIHIQCGQGNVAMAIEEVMGQNDIELVVMGARAGSTIDHIFAGSETMAVIDKSTKPVLVVPLNTDLNNLNKIVFATDYNEADIKGIHYLVKLGKLFNSHLEIVHVNIYHDKDIMRLEKEEIFLKQIKRLKYANISFREISGKEVTHRLITLCQETGADMLAVMHYKNSFIKRIFTHSTTQRALTGQKIPLLIFPREMAD